MLGQSRGGLYVLAGRVVMALSAMAIVIVIARNFSKEISAYYQLAYSMVLLFSIVGQGGMPNATMRYVALARKENRGDLQGEIGLAAICWSALLSAVAYALLFWVSLFFSRLNEKFEFLSIYKNYIGVWGALVALQCVSAELFRAHHHQGRATLFGGVLSQLILLMVVVTLGWRYPDIGLNGLFVASLASAGASLWLSFYYLRISGIVRWANPFSAFEEHLALISAGAKNVGVGLLSYFILQSNIWIVAYFGSTEELALFSVANRLVGALAIVSVVISGAYLPRVTRLLIEGERDALHLLVSKVSFLATGVAFVALVVILGFSSELISILFGRAYEPAAPFLSALALGFFVTSLTGLRSQILMVSGHESVQLKITAGSSLLYVLSVAFVAATYDVLTAVKVGAVMLGLIGLVEVYFLKRFTGILSLPWHYILHSIRRK